MELFYEDVEQFICECNEETELQSIIQQAKWRLELLAEYEKEHKGHSPEDCDECVYPRK